MIVAEELCLKAEEVNPMVVDTDSIGFTDGTGGSRVTYATGQACYLAARELKEKMCVRAARKLEVDEDDVAFEEGEFVCKSDNDKRMTFKEVANEQPKTGGPLVASGTITAGGPTNGFATHIVDVEVDPDTGKVTILRYTAAQDVGTAVHPSYVEGQIQGGVAQGVGWALNEGYFYNEDGTLANTSFLDYRMPTPFDLPMIETILVEVPNPISPHGDSRRRRGSYCTTTCGRGQRRLPCPRRTPVFSPHDPRPYPRRNTKSTRRARPCFGLIRVRPCRSPF